MTVFASILRVERSNHIKLTKVDWKVSKHLKYKIDSLFWNQHFTYNENIECKDLGKLWNTVKIRGIKLLG